jgi:hypothetical protein
VCPFIISLHAGRQFLSPGTVGPSGFVRDCPATPFSTSAHSSRQQHPHADTPQKHNEKDIANCSLHDPAAAPALLRRGRSKTPRGASRGFLSGHGSASFPAAKMEAARRRPEYNLEIFADAACVKDVVKGEFPLLPFKMLFLSIGATFPPPPCVCSRRTWPLNRS